MGRAHCCAVHTPRLADDQDWQMQRGVEPRGALVFGTGTRGERKGRERIRKGVRGRGGRRSYLDGGREHASSCPMRRPRGGRS
jgi:hypothetical protein